MRCELCGLMIDDSDDAMWWHGYGNCVEIPDEMWAELEAGSNPKEGE